VLSDGDGNPRGIFDNNGKFLVGLTSSINGNLQIKNSDGGVATGYSLIEQGTNNYWSNTIYPVTHDLYFLYNGTNKAYIQSSTGAYVVSSDKTLKKNILPITYGLNSILNLKPCTYLMNDQEESSVNNLGFIAQDVKDVIPELVNEMQGGKLGLQMSAIIPVLVKAIQELKAEIDQLKGLK
jgi:hypothetical protein